MINLEGQDIPKDLAAAYWWFRKAAEGGVEEAQYALAQMYEHGDGVRQNVDEAVRWYRAAAEQEYEKASDALRNLGK